MVRAIAAAADAPAIGETALLEVGTVTESVASSDPLDDAALDSDDVVCGGAVVVVPLEGVVVCVYGRDPLASALAMRTAARAASLRRCMAVVLNQ